MLQPPIAFETVRLDRPVDLGSLAGGADLSLEELQALNPELRSTVTPRQDEGYELKVPEGTRETVLLAFSATPTAKPPSFATHVAKKGETLPRIAKRYGVSVTALATANSLTARSKVSRGQEILIPQKVASVSKTKRTGAKRGVTKAAAARETAKSYKVKNGDTLYPDRAPPRRDRGRDPRNQQPRRNPLPQGRRPARHPGQGQVDSRLLLESSRPHPIRDQALLGPEEARCSPGSTPPPPSVWTPAFSTSKSTPRAVPRFTIVGLPDTSVREARERVRSALKNCGFWLPGGAVTVNLAPADFRKSGAALDLPVAIGLVCL